MKQKAILFLALIILITPLYSQAAEIFFGVQDKSVGLDQKFQVGVFINSANESINAVDAAITFPSDILKLDGFYTGNSILPFWIGSPAMNSAGTVSFSGIVPGGFTGKKGYLFSIIFTAKKTGNFSIASSNEKILLNDGNGTQTKVTQAPLNLTVTKNASNPFVPLSDTAPPEPFSPSVSNDHTIFNGKYFLAFAAQDKGTGIDHYEVLEKRLISLKQVWMTAQSPYLLQDQTLTSTIYVKAIDKAGNEQLAIVKPIHLLLYAIYFAFGIIVLAFIIFFFFKK